MDPLKKQKFCSESEFVNDSSSSSSTSGNNLRFQEEVKKEAVCSSKAEREKLRRDKLKEQFLELGNSLDPNRPKRDKASILTDTIQMLKDLMNQVDKLKAEYATLSQESRELVQEKRELREEKRTLKSDIEILSAQYQHRVGSMVPWIPHYTYPIPVVAITQGQSTFISYSGSVNPLTEQASIHQLSSSSSGASNKQDSKSKSADHEDYVGIEFELKIHASSSAEEDVSGTEKKGSLTTTGSSLNSYSSSQAVQDSSSDSVNDILKP